MAYEVSRRVTGGLLRAIVVFWLLDQILSERYNLLGPEISLWVQATSRRDMAQGQQHCFAESPQCMAVVVPQSPEVCLKQT